MFNYVQKENERIYVISYNGLLTRYKRYSSSIVTYSWVSYSKTYPQGHFKYSIASCPPKTLEEEFLDRTKKYIHTKEIT